MSLYHSLSLSPPPPFSCSLPFALLAAAAAAAAFMLALLNVGFFAIDAEPVIVPRKNEMKEKHTFCLSVNNFVPKLCKQLRSQRGYFARCAFIDVVYLCLT